MPDPAILSRIGDAVGDATLRLLEQHTDCDCTNCRAKALVYAFTRVMDGEDCDGVEVAVRGAIAALLRVRRNARQQAAYQEACTDAGLDPFGPSANGKPV